MKTPGQTRTEPAVHLGPEISFGRMLPGTIEFRGESDQFWGSLASAIALSWAGSMTRFDLGGLVSAVMTPYDEYDVDLVTSGIDLGVGGGALVGVTFDLGAMSLSVRANASAHRMTERGLVGLFGADLFLEWVP